MQARIDLPVAGVLSQPVLFVLIFRGPRLAGGYPGEISEYNQTRP